MSLGRAAGAIAVALMLGLGVVSSGIASAYDQGDDGDGKPSWKGKSSDAVRSPQADKIALDRIGDAARRFDIQSVAVFNRDDLDYVGLAIVGRDFNLRRSVRSRCTSPPARIRPSRSTSSSHPTTVVHRMHAVCGCTGSTGGPMPARNGSRATSYGFNSTSSGRARSASPSRVRASTVGAQASA